MMAGVNERALWKIRGGSIRPAGVVQHTIVVAFEAYADLPLPDRQIRVSVVCSTQPHDQGSLTSTVFTSTRPDPAHVVTPAPGERAQPVGGAARGKQTPEQRETARLEIPAALPRRGPIVQRP